MAELEKQGKKGVQHRYDNNGSIDPGTHNFRKVDEQGVAEGLAQGNYDVGLEDIGKPVTVNGKSGYVLLSIGYETGNGKLTAHILQPDTGAKGTYDLETIGKGQQGVMEGNEKHECPHCHGSGRMVRDPDIGTDQECFVCDGTGYVDDEEGRLKEFAPPEGSGGNDDRSRRLRKILEIAIRVAEEQNVGTLTMIHAMNTIASDDFFRSAIEGILPDITDKEYRNILQVAYNSVKQGNVDYMEGKVIPMDSHRPTEMSAEFINWLRKNHPEVTMRDLKDPIKRNSLYREYQQTLKEFSQGGGDNGDGPDEEEILFRLAKQWWLGTEQDMIRAQRTLASMGWDIGEDEGGYDNGGVFVVRADDVNGNSYISWSHEDLSDGQLNEFAQGLSEGSQNLDYIEEK
jgi:hypothetical protein